MKSAFLIIALSVGAALLAGCSSHSSTQEATADCQALAKTNPTIEGAVFKACVACFENCSDCRQQGTSPETFKCPDDAAGGAGATGSTSSASSTGTGN